MKTLSVAIQQNFDLFSHKPRLSEVAPQIPHASPFKRGDYVVWFEFIKVPVESFRATKSNPKGKVSRSIEVRPMEQRGRILGRVLSRNFGWWVARESGGRTMLMDVEMKMWKRPSRSR